jgi:hypothetical protein
MPLLWSLTEPDDRDAINMSLLPELAPMRANLRVKCGRLPTHSKVLDRRCL